MGKTYHKSSLSNKNAVQHGIFTSGYEVFIEDFRD